MRCVGCAKARQKCLYLSLMTGTGTSEVGKLQDADEESEGEEEGEEEDKEEEPEKKTALPVAKVLKKLGSSLRSLGKRKASQRSPELVQDKGTASVQRACDQQPSPIPSINIPEPLMGSSSVNSLAMPPPSSIYSVVDCQDFFYVQCLEHQLWESQEDLKNVICHSELRESILYEEIAHLRARLGEGPSRSGSGSGQRGGASSSSG